MRGNISSNFPSGGFIVNSLVLVFVGGIRASSNTLLQRGIGVYYPLQRAMHSMTSM